MQDEILGRNFLSLEIGLPVEQIKRELRDCLEGRDCSKEIILKARNRRGREIDCNISIGKLTGPKKDIQGLIVLMDEVNNR
jgi:two-component system CheB/CheR fusion protein